MEFLQAGECFCTSTCLSRSYADLISPEGLLFFLMGPETSVVMQDNLAKCHDMTQPIPHYFIKSSHNTYLTGHMLIAHKFSYRTNIWGSFRGNFFSEAFRLSPCSWSVLWRVLSGDVPAVSAVWLPLSGAGLLEGQTSRWRAHHYPRLHHDNWDPLQGGYT